MIGIPEKRRLAVTYERYSPRPEKDARVCLSNELQRERNMAYCVAMGYVHIGDRSDELKTGSNMHRENLLDAIELCCQRRATLVVYDLSRLGRDTLELLQLVKKLRKHKAHLAVVSMHLDTNTSSGRAVLRFMASCDELERDRISERTKAGMRYLQSQGYMMSSKPPFGKKRGNDERCVLPSGEVIWRRTLVDHPGELAALEKLREVALARPTWGSWRLAKRLNAMGVPGRGGRLWNNKDIDRILPRLELNRGDAAIQPTSPAEVATQ